MTEMLLVGYTTPEAVPVGLSSGVDVLAVYHPPSVLQVPGEVGAPASSTHSPISSSASSDSDLSPQELRPEMVSKTNTVVNYCCISCFKF